MSYSVKSSYDINVLVKLLDNPIVGIDLINGAVVNGLTLIFTTPSATVTFSGTDPLSAEAIANQINVGVPGAAHIEEYGPNGVVSPGVKFLHLTRGDTGLTLGVAGTANGVLGFSSDTASAQAVSGAGKIRSIFLGRDGIYRAVVSTDDNP